MTRPWLRKAVLIGVVCAVAIAIVRAVRGGPVPAFEPPGGDGAPWPTLRPEPPSVEPPSVEPPWVEAAAGPPPATHPVKAKLGSGIYHLPGMMNYDRTKPDRYYRSAADAEADGLRASKR